MRKRKSSQSLIYNLLVWIWG